MYADKNLRQISLDFLYKFAKKARERDNFVVSYLDNHLELRDNFGNTKTRATTYDETKKFHFLRHFLSFSVIKIK